MSGTSKSLLFICGSLRSASSSQALVKALEKNLSEFCGVEQATIGTLPHFNADITGDDSVARLNAQILATDGVVIVTPEYNYSIPGVLKNAIDWASRPAMQSVFKGKPVFVITTSAGALGGVRAQAHLKYVLNGMLAEVFTAPEVAVPHAVASITDGIFDNDTTLAFATEHVMAFLASLPDRPDRSQ